MATPVASVSKRVLSTCMELVVSPLHIVSNSSRSTGVSFGSSSDGSLANTNVGVIWAPSFWYGSLQPSRVRSGWLLWDGALRRSRWRKRSSVIVKSALRAAAHASSHDKVVSNCIAAFSSSPRTVTFWIAPQSAVWFMTIDFANNLACSVGWTGSTRSFTVWSSAGICQADQVSMATCRCRTTNSWLGKTGHPIHRVSPFLPFPNCA